MKIETDKPWQQLDQPVLWPVVAPWLTPGVSVYKGKTSKQQGGVVKRQLSTTMTPILKSNSIDIYYAPFLYLPRNTNIWTSENVLSKFGVSLE